MSSHVVGIKPPDEKWRTMKAVLDSCNAAGIPCPREVWDYFDGEEPDEAGVLVRLDQPTKDAVGQEQPPVAQKWHEDMREGFEVHIDHLPKDVKVIRFYNSY